MSEFELDSGDEGESEPFPIPRVGQISNIVSPIIPDYEPKPEEFQTDLFQFYFSLVNYHLKSYDLGQIQDCSPAVECIGHAFELSKDPILTEQIARKYLIDANHHFLLLTADPNLAKIAMLHNDLFYVPELLGLYKICPKMLELCNMIMAETYDLYNSVFSKSVNNLWTQNKTGEEVINALLKAEIEKIRQLNNKSSELLSHCIIKRALENAPPDQVPKITAWAHDNRIIE